MQNWDNIVHDVTKKKIAVGSFLKEGQPTKIEDNTLFVSFHLKNGFHINSIRRNSQVIELILFKYFNVNLKIECIKDKNIKVDKKQASTINNSVEDISKEIPCFDILMEVFDGEIVR